MSNNRQSLAERLPFVLFILAICGGIFAYGVAVGRYQVFPYKFLELAVEGFQDLQQKRTHPWYNKRVSHGKPPIFHDASQAQPGLNLVTCVTSDLHLAARLLDMDGEIRHEWSVDWFDCWPEPTHLPEHRIPRTRPGTFLHGCLLLENGDLVFNYEGCGLIRLNAQSEVVWRLPYQTHHSIALDDDGNLWVGGLRFYTEAQPDYPRYAPPFYADTLVKVSPAGELLEEWSLPQLLEDNGLTGLLEISQLKHPATEYTDHLHLNDIEPFPGGMAPGFFGPGDIAVSMRNVSTVFVFEHATGRIKFVTTGKFLRQHDPDFVDGNHLTVYDNNYIEAGIDLPDDVRRSRIVEVSAPDNVTSVIYEGSKESPFYSGIMGKHQWLANGNLLITESMGGRAFELNPAGEIVWEFVNYIDDGVVGFVSEVTRLPPGADAFVTAD